MIRDYPDPHEHLNRHIDQAAKRYALAIEAGVLPPNEKLAKTLTTYTVEKAKESYRQEANEVLRHNISVIEQRHRERDNKIKREGATMRLWVCPPIAIIFGVNAWLSFSQSNVFIGWVYVVASLTFVGMLVYGWIFDRPEKE